MRDNRVGGGRGRNWLEVSERVRIMTFKRVSPCIMANFRKIIKNEIKHVSMMFGCIIYI